MHFTQNLRRAVDTSASGNADHGKTREKVTIYTTVTVKFKRNLTLRFIILYLSLCSKTLVFSGLLKLALLPLLRPPRKLLPLLRTARPTPIPPHRVRSGSLGKRFLIPTFLPPPGPPVANSQSLCTFPEYYYLSGYTYVCENPAGADCLVYHDSRCLHNAPCFSVSSLSASHTTHPILDNLGPRHYGSPSPFYKRKRR